MRLDPQTVRQQIANLALTYPEIAEDEDAWAITVESETDVHDLLRQVEQRRQAAAAFAGGIASNIAELELRLKRFERREQAMRELAFKIMTFAELKKAELDIATLSIRNGQQKLVNFANVVPTSLPDDLCKIVRELDKTKIKERLKGGEAVPGFELSNAEPTLSVRVK
jgi:hypothetical protein